MNLNRLTREVRSAPNPCNFYDRDDRGRHVTKKYYQQITAEDSLMGVQDPQTH